MFHPYPVVGSLRHSGSIEARLAQLIVSSPCGTKCVEWQSFKAINRIQLIATPKDIEKSLINIAVYCPCPYFLSSYHIISYHIISCIYIYIILYHIILYCIILYYFVIYIYIYILCSYTYDMCICSEVVPMSFFNASRFVTLPSFLITENSIRIADGLTNLTSSDHRGPPGLGGTPSWLDGLFHRKIL